MNDITESDWKIFREISIVALARFCERALSEFDGALKKHSLSLYDRYIKHYKLTVKQDKMMARMFNDLKRSNALDRITFMVEDGLITDKEFARFSEETQNAILLRRQLYGK